MAKEGSRGPTIWRGLEEKMAFSALNWPIKMAAKGQRPNAKGELKVKVRHHGSTVLRLIFNLAIS